MKRVLWAGAVMGVLAGCGGGGQTPECKRFVECVAKTLGSSASAEAKFGMDGSCWSDPVEGEKCTKQCKDALASVPSELGC